jgi:hypothetical protein
MTKAGTLVASVAVVLASAGLAAWGVAGWLTPGVPGGVMNFTSALVKGQPVPLTMQTVGTIGFGAHPSWVSYLVKDPTTGAWVQDTSWELPAHSVIEVTDYQYDTGGPLRNQEWGQIQGVIDGTATLNGTPYGVYNANAGYGVAHTFSIPQFDVNVPLVGVNPNANVCGAAPCTTNYAHNIVKFSFRTPGPGSYYWQCFVPCGLGYLFGNGGPMATQNYMGGELEVVNVS